MNPLVDDECITEDGHTLSYKGCRAVYTIPEENWRENYIFCN
jgi:hypothetical protein